MGDNWCEMRNAGFFFYLNYYYYYFFLVLIFRRCVKMLRDLSEKCWNFYLDFVVVFYYFRKFLAGLKVNVDMREEFWTLS